MILSGGVLAVVGQLPHGAQVSVVSAFAHAAQMQVIGHAVVEFAGKELRLSHGKVSLLREKKGQQENIPAELPRRRLNPLN